MICEVCKKTSLKSPTVADSIYIPLKGGHHRQLDNQCKDPMDKTKDCRVGQLTKDDLEAIPYIVIISMG